MSATLRRRALNPSTHNIPVESVPLGSRITAVNPQRWDYDHSLPEPDVHSWSKVKPPITRDVGETVRLTMIDGTPVHPIWSVDRDDFVEMSELQPGERLQTVNEPLAIRTSELRHIPVPVNNIEVQGQHAYEVTELGILVHNSEVLKCGSNAELRTGWDEALKKKLRCALG